jgi:hypothetical protein
VPVVEISPFYAPDFARITVDEAGKTGYYRALLAGIEAPGRGPPSRRSATSCMLRPAEKFNCRLSTLRSKPWSNRRAK